jgi:FK506-binding protein 2/FK506-binding protein 14
MGTTSVNAANGHVLQAGVLRLVDPVVEKGGRRPLNVTAVAAAASTAGGGGVGGGADGGGADGGGADGGSGDAGDAGGAGGGGGGAGAAAARAFEGAWAAVAQARAKPPGAAGHLATPPGTVLMTRGWRESWDGLIQQLPVRFAVRAVAARQCADADQCVGVVVEQQPRARSSSGSPPPDYNGDCVCYGYPFTPHQASSSNSSGDGTSELQVAVTWKPNPCPALSKRGDRMSMLYTGKLEDGTVFDTTSSPGRSAFEFTLGVGKVIEGWDQGLVGRCKGEKLALTIPPELGYGARGAGGSIPGGATLFFDVEVVGINA